MNHSQYLATSRWAALDGLRAISVLLVVFQHARGHEWFEHLRGWLGVDVFFVISGWLITTLALREESRAGALSLRAFFMRRTFRIFPLYYLVLAVYIAFFYVARQQPDRLSDFQHALPYYLTYLQEVPALLDKQIEYPFEFSWSLGIEEKFYLVWPLLAFVVLKGRFGARVAVTTALIVTCLIAPTVHPYGVLVEPYFKILSGCLLAFVMHNPRTFTHLAAAVARPWVPTAMLALIAAQIVGYTVMFSPILFVATVAALIASVVLMPDAPVSRLLSTRPMIFLGGLSYGMYLFHLLCLNAAERVVPGGTLARELVTVAVAVAVLIPLTWVLKRMVEDPMIAVGRRLSRRAVPVATD